MTKAGYYYVAALVRHDSRPTASLSVVLKLELASVKFQVAEAT
jgi:hypothetical protein